MFAGICFIKKKSGIASKGQKWSYTVIFLNAKKPQDKDLLNIVRLFIMTVIIVLDTCLIHHMAFTGEYYDA